MRKKGSTASKKLRKKEFFVHHAQSFKYLMATYLELLERFFMA